MTSHATPTPAGAAVLLVDDRPENLLALEAVLAPLAGESGVRLLRAGGAEEALRHLRHEDGAIAVVLLDVVTPGSDGLETARLIRARRASEHVPIIFVTGLDADRRRVTLGYQFGAVDYVTKPLDADVLRGKVRAFLDLHQRRGDQVVQERRRYADEVQQLREAALRDETALVTTIQRIGSALASELEMERVVQLVTDEATGLTGAQFGAFFYNVVDPARGGEAYTLYALAGVPREHFASFPHPRATPVFGPTFRGEGVVRSDDITQDPRYGQVAPHHGMPAGHLPVRSYLALPVRSRSGEVLGGLFFGHEQPGVFTEREERLLVGIASWAAVAMDNARLYRAERAARGGAEAARREAEAAARTKSEFLATMSHEFRTPLNAILGYAQLLDMGVLGPATPAQHAHLGRLQASARHLLGLVDDVLDVAKVDAERLEVRRDRLFTGAPVAAAVMLVQPQATAKGVRLLDLGAGEVGVPFWGDEHRVRQVLVNLLSNAVKFTPPGGQMTVTCGAVAEPEPGAWIGGPAHMRPVDAAGAAQTGWAFIRVEDTGPGMSAELLGRLFEPFVQGDGALTREHGGTGLGLAISRRLARLMGGDLTARSAPGKGASFTLWLPGAPTGAADGAPAVESPGAGPAADRAIRQTPLDVGAVAEPSGNPLDDAAYAVLHALGVRLAAEAETVAERYVAALRADGRFPGVRELPAVQLRDHVTPFVGLLASQLMIIGETRGQASELLGDGSQVQRVMAELHGAQRYRLGWSEADIERETALQSAEIVRALAAAVDTTATADVADPPARPGTDISGQEVRVATQYAARVTRHVLEQAMRTAVRAFRFARSAATP